MICELKINSDSKKKLRKNSMVIRHSVKNYQRKTVLRGHEMHSSSNLSHSTVLHTIDFSRTNSIHSKFAKLVPKL